LVLLISGYLVYILKLPSPRTVILTIFGIIISPLVVGYIAVFYFFPAPETIVPEVTWHSSQEAFSIIRDAGLKPRISNWNFDIDIPAGRVIDQSPKKNKRVKVGRIVNLTVSTGQRRMPAPNLIGRPFSQINGMLDDAGLKIGATIEVDTEQYQTGTIINQVPSPEVQIDAGSRISLFIAKNTKFGLVKIPYVVGKPLKEAEGILSDLKLNLMRIEYQETDIVAPGVVMRQEPAWEEEVSVGSNVKLTVSKEMPADKKQP
jgi:eukaryotic-like serine/threonine-protein kinase